MTPDYTAIDNAILAQIRAGANAYSIGLSLAGRMMAKRHEPLRPPWHLIASRLQAMRKAGRIAYSRADRRWIVVATEPQAGEGEAWPFPTGMFTGV